jgi:hypothetical protein
MKKFSQINESNTTVEQSTNKKDFIKNLVNETLSVENGEIKGKEALVKTLNRIIEINDSKTTISVLENVKARSFHNFSFEWINEAIVAEKKKCDEKECEKEECCCKECNCDPCECKKVEESLNESVNEECEPTVKIEISVKTDEEEEKKDDVEILKLDEFEDPCEECEECEECDDIMEERVNFLKDVDELSLIVESIKNGLVESHLDDKDDQLNYILSRFTDKKVEKVVLEKISDLPSYVKTADIEQTLKNMSDEEVEKLYLAVEKVK